MAGRFYHLPEYPGRLIRYLQEGWGVDLGDPSIATIPLLEATNYLENRPVER